jgi:hypothetical protein
MAIFVASITCSNSFEATVPAMETAMGSTMMQFPFQVSYNRMFSIRAAKICQKFEIPHAWSASM